MTKLSVPPIEEGRIRLRLLEESDLAMTLFWRNQDDIRKWFLSSEMISLTHHYEWYREYLERDNDYVFVIEELRDLRRAVGQVSIYGIDYVDKKAEYGRLMIGDPEARRKGIAKEATKLILRYCLNELGIEKVKLEVLPSNEPAIGIYRGCGFEEISEVEGRKEMLLLRKGRD